MRRTTRKNSEYYALLRNFTALKKSIQGFPETYKIDGINREIRQKILALGHRPNKANIQNVFNELEDYRRYDEERERASSVRTGNVPVVTQETLRPSGILMKHYDIGSCTKKDLEETLGRPELHAAVILRNRRTGKYFTVPFSKIKTLSGKKAILK